MLPIIRPLIWPLGVRGVCGHALIRSAPPRDFVVRSAAFLEWPRRRHLATRGDINNGDELMSLPAFHQAADMALDKCFYRIDELDLDDVTLDDGILAISTPNNQQFVINKHFITRQIWYSSPPSGAKYFNAPFDGLLEQLLDDLKKCGVDCNYRER
eukprot:GEMP01097573.1.p1 GENE.GEMP01097573.1~~GEMP01097573.1.p1  ORF type:complete len:156 (+),score=38.65 GEMP01097573.1:51-518(+)